MTSHLVHVQNALFGIGGRRHVVYLLFFFYFKGGFWTDWVGIFKQINMKLGVIIFYSVRFLPIKITKLKFCKIQKKKSKSIQTDWFWFGSVWFSYFILKTETQPIGFGSIMFGSVWLFTIKNQKLYCFFGFFFLLSNEFGFGLVQFFLFGLVFWFQAYETKTKPNRIFF